MSTIPSSDAANDHPGALHERADGQGRTPTAVPDAAQAGGNARRLPLTRRELLQGSAVLIGTLAAGSLLAALAPSTVWAVELQKLSHAEGAALLRMGRVLFPHDQLPDAVYALLARDLDAAAAGDAATLDLLRQGVGSLDRAATGGRFADATAEEQLRLVKAIEGQPFFALVRGKCITSLYDNDMAWAAFGYPGASWEQGGYITRGFQDLKWLSAPPPEVSPKPWIG